MYFHYFFYVVYLIGLAWCSDRFHGALNTISNLHKVRKQPNVNEEKITNDVAEASIKLKKTKLKCLIVISSIFTVHISSSLILSAFFNLWKLGLERIHWIYPIIAYTISILILLVIFWLKGKGGGVPNNKFMTRPGSTF